MAITKVFGTGVVVTPSGQVNEIGNIDLDPGLETYLRVSDGQVDPTYAAVWLQNPVVSFGTAAVARLLGYAGLSGLNLTSATDFYFQKMATGGTRAGGATSIKFSATNGILIPTRISGDDRAPVEVTCQASLVSSDGTTSPLSIALNQTMPTILDADQCFTVGPASINGTAIESVKSVDFDFGFDVRVEGGNGEAYPTYTWIQTRQPKLTLRALQADYPSTVGFFVAQSATDSIVYLRKVAEGGTRVANGTAEHIKFTVDDGLITTRRVNGDDRTPAMVEILIEPTYDGTNDIVAISTASAIT